ncbi:MAG: hypothetical protein KFF73_18065 [Cyclobacteriaceae bacterium]|nr:hypothetical protein [Cyclobacteriaceae bacterium]
MKPRIHIINIILLGSLMLNTAYGQNQQEIDQLLAYLQEGKYVELVNKVGAMRQKAYYKNAFMDYCLAYGYCRLQMPEMSREWFTHIMKSYNTINVEKERELLQLREECSSRQVDLNPTFTMVNYLSSMSNDAFEGNTAGIESKMGIPNVRERVSEIDFEHARFDVSNRQFTLPEKTAAWNYYQNLLGSETNLDRYDTTEHMLIIYSSESGNIKNQIQELERYYQYYNQRFALGGSNRLITVFYYNNRSEFNRGSLKLHNITVPGSTFGYTSSADLILTGIASRSWLGALKHELFHLMVRSSIGDVPPWMDEGIACLFESSSLMENETASFNLRNYRTSLLDNLKLIRAESNHPLPVPSVQELINFSWLDFSGRPGDLTMKASINYSISYVFSKYLLDKGKLEIIINAYRNRTYQEILNATEFRDNPLKVIHIKPADLLMEESMNMNLGEIQQEFENWCLSNLGVNPYQ